jgi:hypothetical protein
MSALETTLEAQKSPPRVPRSGTKTRATPLEASTMLFENDTETHFFDSHMNLTQQSTTSRPGNSSGLEDRLYRLEKKMNEYLSSSHHSHASTSNLKLKESVSTLKQHVKQLGDSTTLACRHLTTGLSEVQEATVNIFDWADQLQRQLEVFTSLIEHSQSTSSGFQQLSRAYIPKIKVSKFTLSS